MSKRNVWFDLSKVCLIVFIVAAVIFIVNKNNKDSEITAKPLPKLIDQLITIPDVQQHLYGNDERTKILFNLIVLKETSAKYEKEIQELKTNIASLKIERKENNE